MLSPLRVVFMGADAIALPMLKALQQSDYARVVAVFTQPDKAVGRGQKVRPNAIKEWALEQSLPVYQPEKLTEETRRQLAACETDLGLVMAYGHLLKDDFISTPRLGTLNLHTSILPAYRGASPIQTAVAEGEKETGVTLMRVVRKLDAGPIVDLEKVSIGPRDTALDIEQKLSLACVPLIERSLPLLAEGALQFTEQDENKVSFCRKLSREDSVLDFSADAEQLASRINGLFPWPATIVEIKGQLIKIGLADVVDKPSTAVSGTILGNDEEGILVAAGENNSKALRLLKLQKPGGRMMETGEFLRGFPVEAGILLPSRAMSRLVSPKPFSRA